MEFGLDKFKTTKYRRRIIPSEYKIKNDELIEAMLNNDTYKYLGLFHNKTLLHKETKIKVIEE